MTSSSKLISKLLLVVVAMFGFGYALVPIYTLFCEITGIGGKTGRIEQTMVQGSEIAMDRWVTVEFTSMSASGLPWDFKPLVNKLKIHPGEITHVNYLVKNKSSLETVDQAIPSVTPNLASKYFNKIECFCFTQQTMAAKEQREMVVRFIVDTDLPEDINTITLSYSFFNAQKYAQK